ncbi:F-box/kelch-repeat protein At3g06240 [Linum perenne]
MVGGEDGSHTPHLTEDIIIKILLYLPIASCIARFRCVCRSWRDLLSDPNFLRKILFYQSSDDQKSLQILISGRRKDDPTFLYSVYSYETLRPITEPISLMDMDGCNYHRVVGCCNGIFCISRTWTNVRQSYAHTMLLWNPTTSEIKIIPPGPSHPAHSNHFALYLREDHLGFGYDPQTRDYKVVRVLEFEESMSDDARYDDPEFYSGPFPLVFTEIFILPNSSQVYSLKNDSWKMLNVVNQPLRGETIYLHQQWSTTRNEKCYWFREGGPRECLIVSFDMSTEVFELVTFPQPVGLAHHYEDEDIYGPYDIDEMKNHEDPWCIKSCFMLRNEVIIVTFMCLCSRCYKSIMPDDEVWVMLKCGVAESWTKLFTCRRSHLIRHLEIWKDGGYICREMCVWDIATGEVIHKNIEIEGTVSCFDAHIFTPTCVSMSQLVNL